MRNRVMISYSHRDEMIANEITDLLRKKRISFWIDKGADERDVNGGIATGDFRKEINKAIKNADVFLVLFSNNWQNSEECIAEYRQATDKELKRKPHVIILKIDDCELNNFSRMNFPTINHISYFQNDVDKQENDRNMLIKDIKTRIRKSRRNRKKKLLVFFSLLLLLSVAGVFLLKNYLSDEYYWNDYIQWNEESAFLVDTDLFGISYEELKEKIDVSLPELKAYPELEELEKLGYTYTSVLLDNNTKSAVFVFNPEGKLAAVYGDYAEDDYQTKTISSLNQKYGNGSMSQGIYTWDISDKVYLQMIRSDARDRVRQEYFSKIYFYYSFEAERNSQKLVWMENKGTGILHFKESAFGMSVSEFAKQTDLIIYDDVEFEFDDVMNAVSVNMGTNSECYLIYEKENNTVMGLISYIRYDDCTVTDQDVSRVYPSGVYKEDTLQNSGILNKSWTVHNGISYTYNLQDVYIETENNVNERYICQVILMNN